MSTTEVESVVSKAGGLVDCVVYGVEVIFFLTHKVSKFSKLNLVRIDHSMIQKFKLPNLEKIAAFKRSLHLEIVALKQKFILASLPPYVLLIVII